MSRVDNILNFISHNQLLYCLLTNTILLFTLNISEAQTTTFIKTKIIKADTQTIVFDTLPISPLGFSVYKTNGEKLDISQFEVNFLKSTIHLKIKCDSIILKYYPLSSQISQTLFHKNKNLILKDSNSWQPQNNFFYREPSGNLLNTDELIKRGSISRGISIGNNQNASVTSSMNLQLSGKLGNDFEIVAALTDNQVPFQPSGNTQQINDFDKIYVQIFNKQNQIILGDYDLINRDNPFMQISRKAQGIQYTFKNKDDSFRFQTSNSVSKGKYNRMLFNGIEGIQGPYKLSGANHEPYIVILAGTERIYIDGKLLIRGENNDYVIDYNTAELTFTAKNPITKDKRITAEFEYSDKNYARFLTYNKLDYVTTKSAFQFQFYDEFDAKNQPLQQTLTDNEKKILAQSGNDQWKAVVPYVNYDTTLNSNSIYYKLKDTTVNNVTYDSIYVYSTDTSAHYRLGFTYVGSGNGNYVQIASQANGRVYKWVAPVNGVKQGDFEPVRILVAPVKKIAVAGSYSLKMSDRTNLTVEFALSDYDKNLFSKLDDNHNQGLAIKTSMIQAFHKNDSNKNRFYIKPYFQLITKYFQAPERFKPVEFSRDWNYNSTIQNREMMGGIESRYTYGKSLSTILGSDWMQSEGNFYGLKEYAVFSYTPNKWFIQHNISYLNTNQTATKTYFIRYQSRNEKYFGKIKTGSTIEAEKNLWKKKTYDSLLNSSFSFYQWYGYIGNTDTVNAWWLVKYGERNDFAPFLNQLKQTYKSQESSIEGHLPFQKHFQGNIMLTYRQLQSYYDTIKPKDNNLTSRTELSFRFAKNAINISTTHESNAGMEQKLSYTYIEVPAGQGVYTWIDYNQNGIKELNEFEVAQFQDQATFIRITSSTFNYIKVYGSRLSQIINLKPELAIENRKGLKKIIAALSNQLAFQQDVKTQSSNLLYRFLPVHANDSERLSLNYVIRNTFSINKTNNTWGIDYILQNSSNTQLLINGIDKRTLQNHTFSIRINPNEVLTVFLSPSFGKKTYTSEYFSNKNYNIENRGAELNIQYQSNQNFRIIPFMKFNKKYNITDNIEAKMQTLGVEMRKNIKTNNFLSLKIDIVKNIYNGSLNSSISYEMLEGLQPGWNQVYSLQVQRNISSTLQMIISYQGRASETSKMIHSGNIEMRAWF
ncbi:MAG: hypothetical protein ACUVQP_04110 [Bacteroidales bacterium]